MTALSTFLGAVRSVSCTQPDTRTQVRFFAVSRSIDSEAAPTSGQPTEGRGVADVGDASRASNRGSPDPARAPADHHRGSEDTIAAGLLAFTFGFALVAQTLLFHSSNAISGDIAYHRGVALTMSAGSFSGEGPIHGILSYFGGLYGLVFGWSSELLGVPFDRVVSVVSWPFVLALPLALLWLGRGIWPGRALDGAVFTFLGTVGSSLALDNRSMWVNSTLPSGTNMWPVYPRDVALVLLVIALAVVVRDSARWRALVAGVIAGIAICVHAQIGVYCVAVVVALLLWRAWPAGARLRWLVDAALVAGTAVVVSVWWWWPRLDEVIHTRTLLLASYPGDSTPDASLAAFVVAFGAVGLLAFPGAWFALRRGASDERFAAAWFFALTVVALVGPLFGDLGLITPRRAWFLAALPLLICASIAATTLIRKGPSALVAWILIAVIAIPSASEAWQTRDLVSRKWATPSGNDLLSAKQWAPAMSTLRSATVKRGSLVVIAPDGDGVYIWEETGAQPFSLWLPGWVKLGFDPAQVTAHSYRDRVSMQSAAFAAGLPGICRLAQQVGAHAIVLRRRGDLVGTYDDDPAAQYRVEPKDRSAKTIDRIVAPGIQYLDRNVLDALVLSAGYALPLRFASPTVRRVDVILRSPRPKSSLTLVLSNGRVLDPRREQVGSDVALVFDAPDGIPSGSRLVATSAAMVTRVIGYEPVPGVTGSSDGPIALDPATICGRVGSP